MTIAILLSRKVYLPIYVFLLLEPLKMAFKIFNLENGYPWHLAGMLDGNPQ